MELVEPLSSILRVDWRALLALSKPRLSTLVILTTGAGMLLAPGHLGARRATTVLLASSAVVAAANALNSYLERNIDARMRRTCQRPLPQGRLEPRTALWLASGVALLAISALYLAGNPLTALLSFIALALYAWVYTPMKQITAWAMVVGAVPGAIPPLMGYTAVTGAIDEAGWALFALLFCWQIPHFLAVAAYLKEDYARGGIQVLPRQCSARATVGWTLGSGILLVPVSLWPLHAGLAGPTYAGVALLLGTGFVGLIATGLRPGVVPGRWARQVFVGSIAYLSVLLCLLVVQHGG